MTDVTDEDRERAMDVLGYGTEWPYRALSSNQRGSVDDIAAALAQERAKAREPFLRIAKEIDPVVALTVHARSDRDIATRIRRAAEEAS